MQTTKNTVRIETVIIADRQAPVTQKQKKTDHIGEELRLEILRLPQLFFSDLEDMGRRVSRSFVGQCPIFFGLCWSGFAFNFSDALFSPCTVCSLEQWPVTFYLMKSHFPFCSPLKSSTSSGSVPSFPCGIFKEKKTNDSGG